MTKVCLFDTLVTLSCIIRYFQENNCYLKKIHLFRRFHIFKTQQVEDKTFDGSLNEIIKEEDELEDKEDDIEQLKRNELEKEVAIVMSLIF